MLVTFIDTISISMCVRVYVCINTHTHTHVCVYHLFDENRSNRLIHRSVTSTSVYRVKLFERKYDWISFTFWMW